MHGIQAWLAGTIVLVAPMGIAIAFLGFVIDTVADRLQKKV